MATNSPNRAVVARAAAILTNAEVAASRIDLNETFNSSMSVQLDFTIGSLTNVLLKLYVSMDGTNYYALLGSNGSSLTQTVTASGTTVLNIHAPGWKFARATVTGTGTVTSSSATLTYRYLRRGSQA